MTHSHDAQGLGLAASQLVTFAPCRGARSGRWAIVPRRPCFVRLRGWASIPPLTTLRAALLPPLRGRIVGYESPASGSRERVREGGQSDGYRTHQRAVARFVGRVLPWRSRAGRTPEISCMRGRVMATRRGYWASGTTCRAVCPGGPSVNNSAQKRYFVNRTTQRLYSHPAHGGGL